MKVLNTNPGYCVICENNTIFEEHGEWLRDNYFCEKCKSIPRQRAVVYAMNLFYPNWKSSIIHESSPCGPASDFISQNCSGYTYSHYFPETKLGSLVNGARCENLESMTFEDQSFDLIITQDVFEHVMHPEKAFKEISRVLKPGGAHVFTMPWYPNLKESVQRARMKNEQIEYLEEPVYHGNPVNSEGSLVTYDWGLDFTDFIYKYAGMYTTIYLHKDKSLGLEAEFLHVFVSRKPEQTSKSGLLKKLRSLVVSS